MFLLMCGYFLPPNEVSTPIKFRINAAVSHQHWWEAGEKGWPQWGHFTHKQRQHCRGGERSRGRMSSCFYVAWTSAIKSTTSWQKPVSRITFEKAAASLSSPLSQQKLPLIFLSMSLLYISNTSRENIGDLWAGSVHLTLELPLCWQ